MVILSVILTSCSILSFDTTSTEAPYFPSPQELEDGWQTGSLTEVGFDPDYFDSLMKDLVSIDGHNLHSLLIVKDGKLVFEEYFSGEKFNLAQFIGETGFDRTDTHNLCSVTKSFTSAILGIAIDQGYIQSVHQHVSEFFPEYSMMFVDSPWKETLTLEDLLTMRSGVDWDDESTSYYDSTNDMYQLFTSENPIEYILSKDVIMEPGTRFQYKNSNTNLIGEIIHRTTGMRIDTFSEKFLFRKLGIDDFEWQMISPDMVFTSGDLRLRPRDMAKFGFLFLSGGRWKDEQIISLEWIEQSTKKQVDLSTGEDQVSWADGYGYQWWQWDSVNGVEFQAYFASGWGGQWIIIAPDTNLVVVSTAGNYYTGVKMPIERILSDYILPAIILQ
jgi:CubicO group peptidase (beta-lactamase class C family)